MRHLDLTETQQISGGLLVEAAIGATVIGAAAVGAVAGWKPVAMAPFALLFGLGATTFTTLTCIPVGLSRGTGITGKIAETAKYWALGPQAAWALEAESFA